MDKGATVKSISFRLQILIGIILIVLGNILAITQKTGAYANLAWLVYGMFFIINPAYPQRVSSEKLGRLGARIGGIVCIAIGLLIKFNP